MNIENQVVPALWNSISNSYQAHNYKAAVLDAIYFLSDEIRQRSGLDSDGVGLIGNAFGGQSPRLKVTQLRTETERSIQSGIEAILRGLFQAIRNPLSHGADLSDVRAANAIILFIDYLYPLVSQAQAPFTLSTFAERIFDPDFVPTEQYSNLLLADVPAGKRFELLTFLFHQRNKCDTEKTTRFFYALYKSLDADQQQAYADILSQELMLTTDADTIVFVLRSLPAEAWSRIRDDTRLRIEHKLIGYFKSGRYSLKGSRCISGGLGTWVGKIYSCMLLQDELCLVVADKLNSETDEEVEFAIQYFLINAPSHIRLPPPDIELAILGKLIESNSRMKEVVEDQLGRWRNAGPDDPWQLPFQAALKGFQPAENSADSSDDIPF